MSAASKKNDPFDFDEIYKQAGVENLFVKKTMAEQKQKPLPGSVPLASPIRPPVATPAPRPAPNAANFDLDFLSTIATPGGTPPSLSKHSSAASLTGTGVAQQQPQPHKQVLPPAAQQSSRRVLDDPFALFEELPGAAQPQKHTPPPAPAPVAPLAVGGGGLLLDFDDGIAFPPAPAVPAMPSFSLLSPEAVPRAPAQPAPSPARQLSAAAAAPPPPPSRPAAAPAPPSPQPPPPDYSDHAEHRPAPPGPTDSTRPLAASAAAGAAGGPPLSPSRPPPSFSDGRTAAGWRDPGAASIPGPREFGGAAGSLTSSSSVTAAAAADYPPQRPPSHAQPPAPPPPHQHPQGYFNMADGPESSQASNSSSPAFTWDHAPAGSGISGYLKAFGKKAVRAAKAGLTQLEHALEGLDQQQAQQAQQGQAQQQHAQGGVRPPSSVGPGRGRSNTDGADVSIDEALAWAVRLADLSPHAQQQELAQMAPTLRRKVIEVLREQVRSEHEAAAAAAAAPASGLGHGAHDFSRAAPPSPPPYGQGAPVPPPRPGSQDGTVLGQQPSGGPRDRAPPLPAYDDDAQHPAAPARPAQPSPPPAPAADFLGIGSDELPCRPAAVAGASTAPAAPAATATAAAVPVEHDLLGFGDDVPPSQAAGRASSAPPAAEALISPASSGAAAPASSSAAPPPPPVAPAPPPPTAIHVGDMDDFFSGGQTASAGGATAAAASGGGGSGGLPMHSSSSAPNLGAARAGGGGGGGAGSSKMAGLADMLHGSDDEGGASADVDVSGYAALYKVEQGAADEPELRRRLRAQREAAKHAKMKAALADKLTMEAEEAARREQQVVLKDQYKADIEAWKNRNKGNIRGLLGSLHTVLWPNSSWVPVSVGDMLEPLQVKKVYQRANLLVHPDKVRQRSGTADQVAIADMVFDVLKDAWNIFR